MLTEKLPTVADVQCGLVLNRKEARNPETTKKTYKRLNLRSLKEDGYLNERELDVYPSIECLDKQVLTQSGDIIIRLFAPLLPILIRNTGIGLVIPSQLAVLRMKNDVPIIPEYLRWYLSSTIVTRKLRLSENLAIQRTVKISELASLDVPIPSYEKQRLMVRIFEQNVKRQALYKELIEQESIYVNSTLENIIGGTAE